MLMARMRRWNVVLVLAATIALAVSPILHNHSLIPQGADHGSVAAPTYQCAFCATNTARIVVTVPQLAAPLAAVARFVDLTDPVVTIDLSSDLSSRAPPAAA